MMLIISRLLRGTVVAFICFRGSYALQAPRPVRNIAICGAGIAGLSCAHALESLNSSQEDFNISIFDARPSLSRTDGAGVQLNGGLAVLGKMSKELQQAVMDAGLPLTKIQSRTKAWNNPTSSTFDTLLELELDEVVRSFGAETEELIDGDKLLWYTIMRGALQEVLLDKLPKNLSGGVHFGKKITDIKPRGGDGGVELVFSDGSTAGSFDLLIGCDGIKSSVKQFIDTGKVITGQSGIYSGIRIRYGVQDGGPGANSPAQTAQLTQYFGDGAYALDGTYGNGRGRPTTKCAYLIFTDEDYIGPFKKQRSSATKPVSENVDWRQDIRKELEVSKERTLDQVRASSLPELDIVPTIKSADRFFELGVYFHNPFSRSWSKEVSGAHFVLCGDAAHAMPPFLGQGANQAIQDAYSLATAIINYNDNLLSSEEEIIPLSSLLKDYERTRWAPCASITIKSILLGYLETGGPNGVFAKFRDVIFRTLGFLGVAKRVLLSAAVPKV